MCILHIGSPRYQTKTKRCLAHSSTYYYIYIIIYITITESANVYLSVPTLSYYTRSLYLLSVYYIYTVNMIFLLMSYFLIFLSVEIFTACNFCTYTHNGNISRFFFFTSAVIAVTKLQGQYFFFLLYITWKCHAAKDWGFQDEFYLFRWCVAFKNVGLGKTIYFCPSKWFKK